MNATNLNYIKVSAIIPAERVAQFYRWVADTHHGAQVSTEATAKPDTPIELAPFITADSALIRTWWAKLSDSARDVLDFLARNADERFTGSELADEYESIAGPSGAAGTFNWPNRHADKLGFVAPWHWDAHARAYFMPTINAAALLATVAPSDD